MGGVLFRSLFGYDTNVFGSSLYIIESVLEGFLGSQACRVVLAVSGGSIIVVVVAVEVILENQSSSPTKLVQLPTFEPAGV